MQLRNFISGLLCVALLPIPSFAAICDANCRMSAIAVATPSSPIPAHAAHHHHAAMGSRMNDRGVEGHSDRVAQNAGANASHGCCDGRMLRLSSHCSQPKDSALIAQRIADLGPDLVVVQTPAGEQPDVGRPVGHHTPVNLSRDSSDSSSLPLRI